MGRRTLKNVRKLRAWHPQGEKEWQPICLSWFKTG